MRCRFTAAVAGLLLFTSAHLTVAEATPAGIEVTVPQPGALISVVTADGDGSPSCIVEPAAAWGRNPTQTSPNDDAGSTIKGVLVGTTVVTCSATALNAYMLVQADTNLIDVDTSTSYANGATPCRVSSVCVDVSNEWLIESFPAHYKVESQLILTTLLPMTKIVGPCVLDTPYLAECTASIIRTLS